MADGTTELDDNEGGVGTTTTLTGARTWGLPSRIAFAFYGGCMSPPEGARIRPAFYQCEPRRVRCGRGHVADSGIRDASALARLACELEAQAATGEWLFTGSHG